MGSCGTITGIGRYLKEKNKAVQIIGIDAQTSKLSQPACPRAYQSEGIGVDILTDTLDPSVVDTIEPVDDDSVFSTTRALAKKGYLVGLSSGAVMHVAYKYANALPKNALAVIIFADSGRSYHSKLFPA
jgi:cystathionine beta-synthase